MPPKSDKASKGSSPDVSKIASSAGATLSVEDASSIAEASSLSAAPAARVITPVAPVAVASRSIASTSGRDPLIVPATQVSAASVAEVTEDDAEFARASPSSPTSDSGHFAETPVTLKDLKGVLQSVFKAGAASKSGGLTTAELTRHRDILKDSRLLLEPDSLSDGALAAWSIALKDILLTYAADRIELASATLLVTQCFTRIPKHYLSRILSKVLGSSTSSMPNISLAEFAQKAFVAYAEERPTLLSKIRKFNKMTFSASREANKNNIEALTRLLAETAAECAVPSALARADLNAAVLALLPRPVYDLLDAASFHKITDCEYTESLRLLAALCNCKRFSAFTGKYAAKAVMPDDMFDLCTTFDNYKLPLAAWEYEERLTTALGGLLLDPEGIPWYSPDSKPAASASSSSSPSSSSSRSAATSARLGGGGSAFRKPQHSGQASAAAASSSTTDTRSSAVKTVRCRDYNDGRCTRGDACRFMHGTKSTLCKFGDSCSSASTTCDYLHPTRKPASGGSVDRPAAAAKPITKWKAERGKEGSASAPASTQAPLPVRIVSAAVTTTVTEVIAGAPAAVFPGGCLPPMSAADTIATADASVGRAAAEDKSPFQRVTVKIADCSMVAMLDSGTSVPLMQRIYLNKILAQCSTFTKEKHGIRFLRNVTLTVKAPIFQSRSSNAEVWAMPLQTVGMLTKANSSPDDKPTQGIPYEWGADNVEVYVVDQDPDDFSEGLILPAAVTPFLELHKAIFGSDLVYQCYGFPLIAASESLRGIVPSHALTQLQLLPTPLLLAPDVPPPLSLPDDGAMHSAAAEAAIISSSTDDPFASDVDDESDSKPAPKVRKSKPSSSTKVMEPAITTQSVAIAAAAVAVSPSPFAEYAISPAQLGIAPDLPASDTMPTDEQLLSTVSWENLHDTVVSRFQAPYLVAARRFFSPRPLPDAQRVTVDIKLKPDAKSSIAYQPKFAPRLQNALRDVFNGMCTDGKIRIVPPPVLKTVPASSISFPPRFNLMVFAGQKPGNPDAVRPLMNAVPLNEATERCAVSGQKSDNLASITKLSGASLFGAGDCADAFASLLAGDTLRRCARFTFEDNTYEYLTVPQGIMEGAIWCDNIVGECVQNCSVPDSTLRAQIADDFAFGTVENNALSGTARRIERDVDHMTAVIAILESLALRGFRGRWQKCHFATTTVSFAGFESNGKSIRNASSRVSCIRDLATPTTAAMLKSHIHLFLYYARLSAELPVLVGKLSDFSLTHSGVPARGLPADLIAAHRRCCILLADNFPVAALNRSKPLRMRPDASRRHIASVIGQYNDQGAFDPIAHSHRRLTPAESNWEEVVSIEALAAAHGVSANRSLVEFDGARLIIESDHQDLCYIDRLNTPRVQALALTILPTDPSWTHWPGRGQFVADTLSRTPPSSTTEPTSVTVAGAKVRIWTTDNTAAAAVLVSIAHDIAASASTATVTAAAVSTRGIQKAATNSSLAAAASTSAARKARRKPKTVVASRIPAAPEAAGAPTSASLPAEGAALLPAASVRDPADAPIDAVKAASESHSSSDARFPVGTSHSQGKTFLRKTPRGTRDSTAKEISGRGASKKRGDIVGQPHWLPPNRLRLLVLQARRRRQ